MRPQHAVLLWKRIVRYRCHTSSMTSCYSTHRPHRHTFRRPHQTAVTSFDDMWKRHSVAQVAAVCVIQYTLAAVLTLEDGTRWSGTSFGSPLPSSPLIGEVVYSTSMTGYVEMLTDPSYTGQLLVLTFPLIGNHGVPRNDTHDLDTRDPRGWPSFEGPASDLPTLSNTTPLLSFIDDTEITDDFPLKSIHTSRKEYRRGGLVGLIGDRVPSDASLGGHCV